MTGWKALERYLEGLRIGQGRRAGERFELLSWQRRFLRGAFGQDGDAALTMGRGGGKTTFVAAVACGAVDVGGPLVEPMAETLGRSEQPHFGRNAIGCGSKIRLRRPIGAMKCWLARRINGPNRQEVASMCPAPALARPMGAWAPRYPVA